VLDKEPTQPRALDLLKQIRAKTSPVRTFASGRRVVDGAVRVDAPTGSHVYIDDDPVGEAPLARYALVPGKHKIEVRRDGFRPDVREVAIEARQTYAFTARLDEKEQVQVALQQEGAGQAIAAAMGAMKPHPSAPKAVEAKAADAKPVALAVQAPKAAPAAAPTPTPAPPPAPAAPVGMLFTDQMTRPARISGADPEYSDAAIKAGVSGVVIAQCDVSEAGVVHGCRILKHVPFMDQPVLDALQSWRMKPATLEGKPVALRSYNFTLRMVAPK
jgi:TonB family protein